MLHGVGIDICENDRIQVLYNKYGKRFLKRIFLDEEIDYCFSKYDPIPHFAARYALKESFVKSLSIPRDLTISYREVGVIGGIGKKKILVTGRLKKMLEQKKINNLFFSIAHGKNYSTACTVLEK